MNSVDHEDPCHALLTQVGDDGSPGQPSVTFAEGTRHRALGIGKDLATGEITGDVTLNRHRRSLLLDNKYINPEEVACALFLIAVAFCIDRRLPPFAAVVPVPRSLVLCQVLIWG